MNTLENLILRVRSYLHYKLGSTPPFVNAKLANRQMRLHAGAIREKADYDDAWLHACAQHAKNVIDVGANQGQAALVILLAETVENLLLLEPNPQALAIAASNLIHANMAQKARFVTAFVSDKNDENIRLWTEGAGAAASMYAEHAKTAAQKQEFLTVRTITIDSLCEMFKFSPDLIKIDIEGAEILALNGSKVCARQYQPRYLVEMHSNASLSMRDNAEMVLDWCKEMDYQAYYLKEHQALQSADTIAHRGRCHLLLQAASVAYPDWLREIKQAAPL